MQDDLGGLTDVARRNRVAPPASTITARPGRKTARRSRLITEKTDFLYGCFRAPQKQTANGRSQIDREAPARWFTTFGATVLVKQRRAERLVAAIDVGIAEPPNEIAAAHAKRSGALQMNRPIGYLSSSKSARIAVEPI
jgi:hypothetical protein